MSEDHLYLTQLMSLGAVMKEVKLIYIAGPIFNSQEREYLEKIALTLENAGYETFLPHRDVGLIRISTNEERKRVFYEDLNLLDKCDSCVALLIGPDHDSGTSSELGYCYARRKPCFGITDDVRWMNNMIWGMCGEGKWIAKNLDELMSIVNSVLR